MFSPKRHPASTAEMSLRAPSTRLVAGGIASAAVLAGLLIARTAPGASLSGPVTGWASGVPSYISMYEYVPDAGKLAKNPPILVVSHQCGGSAAGIYGW